MKKIILVLLASLSVLLMFSCSGDDADNSDPVKKNEDPVVVEPEEEISVELVSDEVDKDIPVLPSEWTLVFKESFDKDLSEWNIWEGGAFNDELQLYGPDQLVLKNGVLLINAKREAVTGAQDKFNPKVMKDFDFVSGRIESKTTFGPSSADGEKEYRISARIKLPAGFGMWPAFWTFADPWPTKGEIDILEARGNEPKKFQSNVFYGTMEKVPTSFGNEKSYTFQENLTSNFHLYELIWTKNRLSILFDNKVRGTYTDIKNAPKISDLFGKKHQIILNLAVGGIFFPNTNSSSYASSGVMEVDWVRVYKK